MPDGEEMTYEVSGEGIIEYTSVYEGAYLIRADEPDIYGYDLYYADNLPSDFFEDGLGVSFAGIADLMCTSLYGGICLSLTSIKKLVTPWYKSPWVIAGGIGLGLVVLASVAKR